MSRMNGPLLLGILYFGLMVGFAFGKVGALVETPKPFDYTLPILVAVLIGLPFILGFLAGKRITPFYNYFNKVQEIRNPIEKKD